MADETFGWLLFTIPLACLIAAGFADLARASAADKAARARRSRSLGQVVALDNRVRCERNADFYDHQGSTR